MGADLYAHATSRGARARLVGAGVIGAGALALLALAGAGMAGASPAPQKAQAPAQGAVAAGAHAVAPSALVLRQTFAYGSQRTAVNGVALSGPTGAVWGGPNRVRARLGKPWRCAGDVARWRAGALTMQMRTLNAPRACVWGRAGSAGYVAVSAKGARFVSDRGTVRVGQRWSAAPGALRRAVSRMSAGGRVLHLGRFQDECLRDEPSARSGALVRIRLSSAGRIMEVRANMRIRHVVECPSPPPLGPLPITPEPTEPAPAGQRRAPSAQELLAISAVVGAGARMLCPSAESTFISADPLWAVTSGMNNCNGGSSMYYVYLRRPAVGSSAWVEAEVRSGLVYRPFDACGSEAVPADIRCPSAYQAS